MMARSSILLYSFLFLLLSVLFFSCVFASSEDSDSDSSEDSFVFTLTDTNFDELTSEGAWLVEFYAPWCGHCKKLAPVYEEAAKKLNKEGSTFRLAKIDATAEKELASRYQIRSYPTLKFKRGDDLRTYNGARTVEAILSYAREMTGPPVQSISSANALKALTAKHPIIFALFSSSSKSEIALKSFTDVAFRLQGIVKFIHVATDGVSEAAGDSQDNEENEKKSSKTVKKLMEKYGLKSSELPAVVLISAGEDAEPFTGPFDDSALLKEWVWTNRFPLLNELEGSNFEELTSQNKLLILLITDPKSTQQSHAYSDAALPVAKKYKGRYIFATVDGNKFSQYVTQFSVDSTKDLPTTVALDYPEYYYSAKEFYPLSGSLPAHQIDDFVDAVADGKISASGTIPWYNPQRYFKKLERFLNSLSTTSFVATVVLMTVVFVGIVFYCCKCLIGFDGEEDGKEEEEEGEEEDNKKEKGKESANSADAKTTQESTATSSANVAAASGTDSDNEIRQRKSKRAD